MAVGPSQPVDYLPVPGIRAATTCAGIKKTNRDDLTLFEIQGEHAACAAVFTKNAFCAAPVHVAKSHLAATLPRYLLINSGNANAGLGHAGLTDANQCCGALADLLSVDAQSILPFSTGVIAEPLPVGKIVDALPALIEKLDAQSWSAAARAIMTTDTRPKAVSRRVQVGDASVTITGIAKGAGMIQPNMATMLSFIATDARIDQSLLQTCLQETADASFNCISVDGDTSTNDSLVLMATGAAEMPAITHIDDLRYQQFFDAILSACQELAEAIVRDGEGATKLLRIRVSQAADSAEARQIGMTVANSPLVKTALFAGDPNWGRVLAAVGRAGIVDLDVTKISIHLDEVQIVAHGQRHSGYTEAQGQAVMSRDEICMTIDLGRGDAGAVVLTCDFSYEYVRINAEYRT